MEGEGFCFPGPAAASVAPCFGVLGPCVFHLSPATEVFPCALGVQHQLSFSQQRKDFVPWGEGSRQASCSAGGACAPLRAASRLSSGRLSGHRAEPETGCMLPLVCSSHTGLHPAFPNSLQVLHCVLLTAGAPCSSCTLPRASWRTCPLFP